MGLALIAPPEEEPVSLAAAKLHLRVDGTAEDGYIRGLVAAARMDAEHQTGRALVAQTWRLTLDAFPPGDIELPRPPLQSVKSITYLDADGVRQTIDPAEYRAITDELFGRVVLAYNAAWPSCRSEPGSVQVTFVSGWPEAADVPEAIRHWIKIKLTTLYEQRGMVITGTIVSESPRQAWDVLLDGYRVRW
jgi:uncharacterized phiE125 gp8 family phage protein